MLYLQSLLARKILKVLSGTTSFNTCYFVCQQLCGISEWRLGDRRLNFAVLVPLMFLWCYIIITLIIMLPFQEYALSCVFIQCLELVSFSRCTLASYILGLEVDNAENRKNLERLFPVFFALLDALLLRAQVCPSNNLSFCRSFSPCLTPVLAKF